MKVMVLDDCDPPPPSELAAFEARPNAILYTLEATRVVALGLIAFNILQIFVLFLWKGLSLVLLLKLALLADCILFSIFAFVIVFLATGLTFFLTRKDVIIRFAPFGRPVWHLCVPIEDIEVIEVRTYGRRYGSIYLRRYDRRRASAASTQGEKPREECGGPSAWLSLPWSWPPLIGFYGFKNYRKLVNRIIDLRTTA